jgi:hypothetical protein
MHRSVSVQRRFRQLILTHIAAAAVPAAAATVSLESAPLAGVGVNGGQTLSATQFMGWRFSTTKRTTVNEVGGHLAGFSGNLFAALVALPKLDALPTGAPFATAEVVASKVFSAPSPSTDFATSLTVTLSPGSYALVFGSGQFDASGVGAMVNNPLQTPNGPTTPAPYILWKQVLPQVYQWTVSTSNNVRFFVRGVESAGPEDFNADLKVDGGDLANWRTGFGREGDAVSSDGDANGDAAVDGLDFLRWQRTAKFAPSGAARTVPEPALTASLCALAPAMAARRRSSRVARRR